MPRLLEPRRCARNTARPIRSVSQDTVTIFPSALGWMALAACDNVVKQLTFGHETPDAALAALDPSIKASAQVTSPRARTQMSALVKRLQAYAEGASDDFLDVLVESRLTTAFQRRVIQNCRRIAVGKTLSYGELATKSGAPRAARAVGNVMRTNRVPIIVPCHRVVAAGGYLGGYSAGSGLSVKVRLLKMEGVVLKG